jgi:predicted dehydrogenase
MQVTDKKILVAGVGSIGKRHTEVLYSSLRCRDITVYDPVANSTKAVLEKYPGIKTVSSFEEGLSGKPDAVWITTPTALHVKQTIQALEAGCHVMVEKPLDVSLEHTARLKEMTKSAKKIVSVAFCWRKYTGMVRVKEIVKSGILGKIVSVRAKMTEFFPDARPDYKNTYYIKYGGVMEQIHALDNALWIAGGEPKKICGICGSYADLGFESPDNAEILFETDTSVICNISLSFSRSPSSNLMNVYGTQGSLEMVYDTNTYTLRTYTRSEGRWNTETKDGMYRNLMFEREDMEFLEDTISGIQRGCSVEEAEGSLKIYCEVYGNKNPPPEGWD